MALEGRARRQAIEAALHRWDAQTAVGTAEGFPVDLAAAGISAVVDDLFPRQVALHRASPLSMPLVLRATDRNKVWVVDGDADASGTRATITGPARVLLLYLWGRTGLGDPQLAWSGPPAARRELAGARFTP